MTIHEKHIFIALDHEKRCRATSSQDPCRRADADNYSFLKEHGRVGKVIPILAWQSTAIRWFCCYECAYQFRQQVRVTMRSHVLTCPGCEQVGFVIGQAKR